MSQETPARKPSPSELTDAQWTMLEPLMPTAHPPHGGGPRAVDMRAVVKTLLSLHRSGCQGEMRPHDWRPKSPVDDDVARWRGDGTWATMRAALRAPTRRQADREPTPRAACIDRQAVKTTAMGGAARGDAGGKQVNGRQRHLLVDTLGVLIVVLMTRAGGTMEARHRPCCSGLIRKISPASTRAVPTPRITTMPCPHG
jgi:putative transposase